ncbi:MAG: DUF4105 domain-containing protein [Bacteroidota bacterium]
MLNKYKLTLIVFLSVLLIIILPNPKLKAQKLSENAEISLLTCNPGEELYSVFGHNAIRVNDPVKKIDWVYNYGTFSFEEPNFYVKFVRGQLNYMLSVNHFTQFIYSYQQENRTIREQVLNLTDKQKQDIFKFLEINRLPQNKYYLYDFFFDNCATRVRDVFEGNMKNDLIFATDYKDSLSFRDLLSPYLKEHHWSRFGINLILGSIVDRNATLSETAFLPDYLEIAVSKATNNINGKKVSFVNKSSVLFTQTDVNTSVNKLLRPGFVFWALFIFALILLGIEFKNNKIYLAFDFIYFLFIGIIGLILFFAWFFTEHTAVVNNWNLLWALPTHFFIIFFFFVKNKPAFLKYYFLISGSIAILFLPLWTIIPQVFDFAFIPMILTISVRSFYYWFYYR